MTILNNIYERKDKKLKSLALLIDPDKFDDVIFEKLNQKNAFQKADYIFVGGSLIQGVNLGETIAQIKTVCEKPIIIFPGSNMHIDSNADGILLLSLISGRNSDFLIGQHIVAAPILKKSKLEILATGYMLIEGGKPTTASYMSNTTPIPHDKPEVAACTAMAGEMLGLKLIYADTGSGANKSVSNKMIYMLKKTVNLPIIVGGGVRTAHQAQEIWEAGADVLVVGNAIEENPDFIDELFEKKEILNEKVNFF
ncbi:MAG: geranylgeranylglyceryl/heptaprenylglyceryl phosphate synthase [Cytophagia bacterium]|nr:MAG: geranylgeranylglyceryl/heptaprenylglyceryl phosphate synthase [Cytophagales bacterium]TAG04362.1 MAG: geranylgeranylglyceryl/heptaprenylglyceryl phosphate synthase [Cytophagia bacterium]TAG38878.1 MAG: geranylgeranylglyceryl/heptaprenylglyceryl phosphate synthase [Cytophagia bacterium]TAH28894.1 MAG: geranylgeranylglyceryl/heptaprenylglyceryl phosphate synthase [Cytophagales bacterium]